MHAVYYALEFIIIIIIFYYIFYSMDKSFSHCMMHIHFLCMFINNIYFISFFLISDVSYANLMKSQISNISELVSEFKVCVKLAFLGQWHIATSLQCSNSGVYSRL